MALEKMHDTNGIRSTVAQTLAALGFSAYSLNIGLIFAMPTIVIGDLRGKDSPLGLTESQCSWFGSLYFITQPVGSMVSCFLQDWMGRKRTLMMINVPQLTAWAILYFSTSTTHLFIALGLLGLSIGFLEAPILSYVGEISQPRLRSIFSSFLGISYNTGIMIEAFIGAAFPWRTMILCNMIGPLVGLFAMSMLPESPAWLVTKGRVEEAEKAYQWLRGWVPPEAVRQELDTLVSYVQDTQRPLVKQSGYELVANGKGSEVKAAKCKRSWEVLLEPEVLTAFRIVLLFFTVFPFAILFAMRPFFIEILDGLNLPVESRSVVVLCGVVTMLSSLTLGALTKILGKRKFTFISMGISILCCFGLGGYLKAELHRPWIPVMIFCVSYFFGAAVMMLSWTFLIELFPLRARSIGCGFCAAYAYVIYFLVTKTYYNLVSWLDVWGTCWLYGSIGLVGLVYLYVDLPETEGHALEDIERELTQRRTSRKNRSVKNETDAQYNLANPSPTVPT